MEAHNDYFLSDKSGLNFGNYYWFKKGFPKPDILKLDDLLKRDNPELQKGTTFGKTTAKETRDSKISWLPENDSYNWIYDKMVNFTETANNEMWKLSLSGLTERIQYSEYGKSNHYTWHMDIGKGHSIRRKISLIVQLSDPNEYEGGDVEFQIEAGKVSAPKDQGAVIAFPSFFLHRVSPVTKGVRKSLVVWVSGPSWK